MQCKEGFYIVGLEEFVKCVFYKCTVWEHKETLYAIDVIRS